MPTIPIPQQVPISGASWNNGFNPSGIGQGADAVGTTTTPLAFAQQNAGQQADNFLKQAQTASTVNEVQQKQRAMQLSMVSAALNSPNPEQALQNIVPIANKLNPSYQIDSDIDVPTARALAMSQVPVADQPALSMAQSKANLFNNALSSDGGNGSNTNRALAIVDPAASNAVMNTSEGRKEAEEGTKTGENLADAQKTFNVTYSNLPLALQRFKMLRDAATDASYGVGSGGLDQSFANTRLGHAINPKTAAANQTLESVANQGLISELSPMLQGMKPNLVLDKMASKGNLLNPEDRPEVKVQGVDRIENQYVGQLKASAATRRAYGDKNVPTDEEIDAQVAKLKGGAAAQIPASMQNNNQSTPGLTTPDAIGKAYQQGTISSEVAKKLLSQHGYN